MDVSYKRLFKILIEKDLKKTEFAKLIGIGQNTLAKLSKNENVNTDILRKICIALDCDICDIMEMVESNPKGENKQND